MCYSALPSGRNRRIQKAWGSAACWSYDSAAAYSAIVAEFDLLGVRCLFTGKSGARQVMNEPEGRGGTSTRHAGSALRTLG